MTDHTLARADEVLTELVELVETARSLPMSTSCVVPRERTLDLLDALREVLPPEMIEARRVMADRDRVLAEANARAAATISEADEAATRTLAEAQAKAEQLLSEARAEAYERVEQAKSEQADLVSAASVHQAAVAEAARLQQASERSAAGMRDDAERYAGKLTSDAQQYAARTLSELVDTLQRLLATAENGRAALSRPAGAPVGQADPAGDVEDATPEHPADDAASGGPVPAPGSSDPGEWTGA